jgi:hypothetical protein
MIYIVTIPVANDPPAFTTVTTQIVASDSEAALDRAINRVIEHGYTIDNDRCPTVELD